MTDAALIAHDEPQAPAVPQSESAALISMIERAARDPAVDIDKMERLLKMKADAVADNARRAYTTALAAARGKFKPIQKNRRVKFESRKAGASETNYQHEDLAAVATMVDPILMEHGLSYRFRSQQENGTVSVTCIISHADGHEEETTLVSKEDHSGNKNNIQAIGSAATYLQRYTLKLALGLSASNSDDDGAATSEDFITEDQAEDLAHRLDSDLHDKKAFCNFFKISKFSELPAARYSEALKLISEQEKIAAKKVASND